MNLNSYLFTNKHNLDAIFDSMSILSIYKNNYSDLNSYEGILFFKTKDYQQFFNKYSDKISSLFGIGERESIYTLQLFLGSEAKTENIFIEGIQNTYLLKSDIDIFSIKPLGYWSLNVICLNEYQYSEFYKV